MKGMDDTSAFEDIYVEFRDRVSRYVHARVGNFHDAQDVVSGVFLKIETALGRYDSGKASLSSWIYAITRNAVRDYFRRIHPCEDIGEMPGLQDEGESPEEAAQRHEMLGALNDALGTLSDRERDVIVMRYYLGMSPGEVAQRMGISYSNEGFIQSTALKKLRGILSETRPHPEATPKKGQGGERLPFPGAGRLGDTASI